MFHLKEGIGEIRGIVLKGRRQDLPAVSSKGLERCKMYRNVEEYVQECTGIYRNAEECTGIYRNVEECRGIKRNVQECRGIYRDVEECTGIYRNVQECTGIYRNK